MLAFLAQRINCDCLCLDGVTNGCPGYSETCNFGNSCTCGPCPGVSTVCQVNSLSFPCFCPDGQDPCPGYSDLCYYGKMCACGPCPGIAPFCQLSSPPYGCKCSNTSDACPSSNTVCGNLLTKECRCGQCPGDSVCSSQYLSSKLFPSLTLAPTPPVELPSTSPLLTPSPVQAAAPSTLSPMQLPLLTPSPPLIQQPICDPQIPYKRMCSNIWFKNSKDACVELTANCHSQLAVKTCYSCVSGGMASAIYHIVMLCLLAPVLIVSILGYFQVIPVASMEILSSFSYTLAFGGEQWALATKVCSLSIWQTIASTVHVCMLYGLILPFSGGLAKAISDSFTLILAIVTAAVASASGSILSSTQKTLEYCFYLHIASVLLIQMQSNDCMINISNSVIKWAKKGAAVQLYEDYEQDLQSQGITNNYLKYLHELSYRIAKRTNITDINMRTDMVFIPVATVTSSYLIWRHFVEHYLLDTPDGYPENFSGTPKAVFKFRFLILGVFAAMSVLLCLLHTIFSYVNYLKHEDASAKSILNEIWSSFGFLLPCPVSGMPSQYCNYLKHYKAKLVIISNKDYILRIAPSIMIIIGSLVHILRVFYSLLGLMCKLCCMLVALIVCRLPCISGRKRKCYITAKQTITLGTENEMVNFDTSNRLSKMNVTNIFTAVIIKVDNKTKRKLEARRKTETEAETEEQQHKKFRNQEEFAETEQSCRN